MALFRPLLRTAAPLLHPPRTPLTLARHALPAALTPSTSFTARRTLASRSNKKKVRDEPDAGKIVNTDALVPGSQRIVQSEEYVKAEGKMKAALDFFRKEVAALEMRASGRVTPAVLAPVRVHVPGSSEGKGGSGAKLEEVATVGVRDGSMLIVTVFEEQVRATFVFMLDCSCLTMGAPFRDVPHGACCVQ